MSLDGAQGKIIDIEGMKKCGEEIGILVELRAEAPRLKKTVKVFNCFGQTPEIVEIEVDDTGEEN